MKPRNIQDYISLFGCDTARISKPLDRMFLIIGWNRNTNDDNTGQWLSNGEPIDFQYVEEHCIAAGDTDEELWKSATRYKGLMSKSSIDLTSL